MVRWVIMMDPLRYFSFQTVLHDWCNKGRGLCYHLCGVVHIKEPLLLIGKSSPCSGRSGFPLSQSEWPLSYVWRHINVNKTFPSFLINCYGESKTVWLLSLLNSLGCRCLCTSVCDGVNVRGIANWNWYLHNVVRTNKFTHCNKTKFDLLQASGQLDTP